MRARARAAVVAVVMLGLSMVWVVVTDRAWPAEPRCVTADGSPCLSSAELAARFRDGRIADSHGYRFSPHTRRLILRWYDHHPAAARRDHVTIVRARTAARTPGRILLSSGDGHWWNDLLQTSECLFWRTSTRWCVTQNMGDTLKAVQDAEVTSVKVSIRCGGAALIAGMRKPKGGSWTLSTVGAGLGATSCLYDQVVTPLLDLF